MNKKGYPVRWRQETYYLSDLTAGVKDEYCAWLYRRMLDNARRRMEPARYLRFEKSLTANPPEWTSVASEDVLSSLDHDDSKLALNRLLLGLSNDEMDDDNLRELIAEKEVDAGSDYVVAMAMVRENTDPKVKKASRSLPDTKAENEPTRSCATTPSGETSNMSAV